jgi:RNA polymerase sigma factor (sigma-70 family)
MTAGPARVLLRHLRRLTAGRAADGVSDRELLERFSRNRDEAAFAALFERHGAMVLRVGRRALASDQDAEDVLQACFLLLARKAGSVAWQASVAGWLYRTAYHLALKARSAAACRAAHERRAAAHAARDPADEISLHEAQAILEEELDRLPDRLRAPVLLCCLEGCARDEAARRLGWSLATLKRRLGRGRDLLRLRLVGRGLGLTSALAAVEIGHLAAPAAVPAPLASATLAAVTAGGAVSGTVSDLVREATRPWALGRRTLAVLLLSLSAGVGAVSALAWPRSNGPDAPLPAVAPSRAAEAPAAKVPTTDLYGDDLPAGAVARYGTLRLRHPRHPWAAAISPDKTRLASRDGLDRLLMWDLKTGQRLWIASPSKAYVMAFSPDGKTLAVAEEGRTELRDAATGDPIHTIEGTGRLPPQALAFTRDGKQLLIGDATLRVWDLERRKQVREFKDLKGAAYTLALSPDGRLVVAAGYAGKILVWELKTGDEKAKLNVGGAPILGLSFSADGKLLAAGHHIWAEPVKDREGKIVKQMPHPAEVVVWEVKSGREVRRFEKIAHPHFLPDGKTLLAERLIDNGPTWLLARVDLRDWTVHGTDIFLGHRQAFATDGRLAAAVCSEGLWLWSLPEGKRLLDLPGHETPVGLLAVSPDGRWLASGHGLSTLPTPGGYALHVWDTATAKHAAALVGGKASASVAAFSRDGRRLAAADMEGVVRVWNVPGWKPLKEVKLPRFEAAKDAPFADLMRAQHGKTVHALAWAGDQKLLTASTDGKVRLVDLEAGKVVGDFEAAEDNPNKRWRAAFTADGRQVAALSQRAWGVFDARTGKLQQDLDSKRPGADESGDADQKKQRDPATERQVFVMCLTMSDDGRVVAAGTYGQVRLWDAKSGKLLRALGADGHTAFGIALSPDSRFLATAGDRDRTVRLWRVADGKELASFKGHEADVYTVAFARDGRSLFSGSADCTVLRWDTARWTTVPNEAPAKGTGG